MRRKVLSSRKKILLYYTVLISLIFILISSIFYVIAYNTMEKKLVENAYDKTNSIKDNLKDILKNSSLNYLRGNNEAFYSLLDVNYRKGISKKDTMDILIHRNKLNSSEQVYIVDRNGNSLNNRGLTDIDIDFNKLWDRAEKENQYYTDDSENAYYISYFTPWDLIVITSINKETIKSYVKEDIRDNILKNSYEYEYSFLIDDEGNVIVHPFMSRNNILDISDKEGKYYVREIIEKKSGKIKYTSDIKKVKKYDERLCSFEYIEGFNWIIATTVSEGYIVKSRLNDYLIYIIFIFIIFYIMTIMFIFYIFNITRKPVIRLRDEMKDYLLKEHKVKLKEDIYEDDEVKSLTYYFDELLIKVKEYSNGLISKNNELKGVILNRDKIIEESIGELQDNHEKSIILREMSNLIQKAVSEEEVHRIIHMYVKKIILNPEGGLYIKKEEEYECVISWGERDYIGDLHKYQCWAMRTGKIYYNDGTIPLCNHVDKKKKTHICIPLYDGGRTFGLLTFDLDKMDNSFNIIISSMAETIGICLSNFRFRQQLKGMMVTDPLTKIYNRRYLEEEIKLSTIDYSQGIIIMDIDNFKNINDTYGHLIGDDVLLKLVHITKSIISYKDFFIRYGGEEFLLVQKGISFQEALSKAEEIRDEVQEKLRIEELGISCTLSIGLAYNFNKEIDINTLINEADKKLYEAKNSGKNKVKYITFKE